MESQRGAAGIRIARADDLEDAFFGVRTYTESISVVSDILSHVRVHGDSALHEYSRKFDNVSPSSFEIPCAELKRTEQALETDNPDLYKALCYSRDLAFRFASRQRESFDTFELELEPGLFTGQRTVAVDRAGVYVPAGRFPLVSTVIMTLVPAKAAGVGEVILCTPPKPHPDGSDKPWGDRNILAAASLCGVDRVFAVGGAQAIAAMAYGTESIPSVPVIVGPGNKYVAEAKRMVYGTVGIDMLAGPSEVLIIADDSADPVCVAADMLAQAEHDPDAQAVLVTISTRLSNAVQSELSRQLAALPAETSAAASIAAHGYIILADSLEQAAEIANRKAPEHLELALVTGPDRSRIEQLVHNFGSLFIGHDSAEVLGDYAAGLNHTLPTSGWARFSGGLSVRHFLKTVTTLRVAESDTADAGNTTTGKSAGLIQSATAASVIGDAEGLVAHARAARLRLKR
jgi:histidinol dehydrogenase